MTVLGRWQALGIGLVLALSARRAFAECEQARSVALTIVLGAGDDAEGRRALERLVSAELRASDIDVCSAVPAAALLAQVEIRTPSRGLERTTITVRQQHQTPFERTLELGGLPPEARPLAIASAADELLRSVLARPRAQRAEPPVSSHLPADAPSTGRAGLPAQDETEPASFALGVAAAVSSHFGERDAVAGDVLGRFWPSTSIAVTLRVGGAKRLSRPLERGWVQANDDLHAAFAVGLELLPPDWRVAVLAEGGVNVLRVSFDQPHSSVWAIGLPDIVELSGGPLDSAWALVGSIGAEGRVRAGPIAFGITIAGLIPLVPATSDWAETTSLQRIGAEVRAGIWMPLVLEAL